MFKIIGADQREYGPVPPDQLRRWIAEGRAIAQTLVQSEGATDWQPLSSVPEFADALAGNTPTAPPLPSAQPPAPPSPKANGMAIAGFVCGIIGLFCCGPIFSTLGLVFSIVGLAQIKDEPEKNTGRGLAIAGIVIALAGYLSFSLLLVTGTWNDLFNQLLRR